MKLNYLTPEDFKTDKTPKQLPPKISVGKAGGFRFSQAAIEKMGVVPGDRIQIAQDEKEPTNFFIVSLGKKGDGFELRPVTKWKVVQFNNIKLREKLDADIFSGRAKDKTLTFLIGSPTTIDKKAHFPLLAMPAE
jgi:hypothetical protein